LVLLQLSDGFTKSNLLENPEFILCTDGSSIVEGSVRKAGWAVTTMDNVIVTGTLTAGASAQVAEWLALTEACKQAEGEKQLISAQTQGMLSVLTMIVENMEKQRIHDITGSSCEEWTRGSTE
jgi:hypothetical protein